MKIRRIISVILIVSMMFNSFQFAFANGVDLGTIQSQIESKKDDYKNINPNEGEGIVVEKTVIEEQLTIIGENGGITEKKSTYSEISDGEKDDDSPDLTEYNDEPENDSEDSFDEKESDENEIVESTTPNNNENEEIKETTESKDVEGESTSGLESTSVTESESTNESSSVMEQTEESETTTIKETDETTKESIENEETTTNSQDNNSKEIVASESDSKNNIDDENNNINDIATESVIVKKEISTESNINIEENNRLMPVSTKNNNLLFGSGENEYILPNNWYNQTSAGINKNSVTSITISKAPDAEPSATYKYDIANSNGLKLYISGNSVTIYAPNDWPIYAAPDSSGLFKMTTNNTKNLSAINGLNLLNTSRVTNMSSMFERYVGTSLDLSNFVTASVSDMSSMFYACSNITNLDVSSFDTKEVLNMAYMFYSMDNVKKINISSFNTSKVTNMAYMFYEDDKLTTIYASRKFTTTAVVEENADEYMFWNCTALIGGNGTTYQSKYDSMGYEACLKRFARLDTMALDGFFSVPPGQVAEPKVSSVEFDSDGNVTFKIKYPQNDDIYTGARIITNFYVSAEGYAEVQGMSGGNGVQLTQMYLSYNNGTSFVYDDSTGEMTLNAQIDYRGGDWRDFQGYMYKFDEVRLWTGDPGIIKYINIKTRIGSDKNHKWVKGWLDVDNWKVPEFGSTANLSTADGKEAFRTYMSPKQRVKFITQAQAETKYNKTMTTCHYDMFFNTSLNMPALMADYPFSTEGDEKTIYFILDDGDHIVFDGENSKELFKDTNIINVDWQKVGNSQSGLSDNGLTTMEGWFEGTSFAVDMQGSSADGNFTVDHIAPRLDMFIHLDTSRVTTLKNMFKGCHDVYDTNSPEGAAYIAGTNPESDTLFKYRTQNVVDMSGMFDGATFNWGGRTSSNSPVPHKSIFSEIARHLDTSNLIDATNMFKDVRAYDMLIPSREIDMSIWETPNLRNANQMFYSASFTTAYVNEYKWATSSIIESYNMFTESTIVGENRSKYGDWYMGDDVEYARRDTYYTPGYFTHVQDTSISDNQTLYDIYFSSENRMSYNV